MRGTEEWDPWVANNRDLATMQRIALEATELGDDPWAFHSYAKEHKLTVNEVVYYLNAYEYGGVAGLEAIRNPDIIPPNVARGPHLRQTRPDGPRHPVGQGQGPQRQRTERAGESAGERRPPHAIREGKGRAGSARSPVIGYSQSPIAPLRGCGAFPIQSKRASHAP